MEHAIIAEKAINYTVITYLLYMPISILLTIWVARTLFTHGRIFLVDIFHGDETLADSVNKLLLVGFYLINIGYIVLALKIMGEISDYRGVIEILSVKVGTIILILGGMHFFNLFVFFKLKKRGKKPPPKEYVSEFQGPRKDLPPKPAEPTVS